VAEKAKAAIARFAASGTTPASDMEHPDTYPQLTIYRVCDQAA
jgi:hypothetical protein